MGILWLAIGHFYQACFMVFHKEQASFSEEFTFFSSTIRELLFCIFKWDIGHNSIFISLACDFLSPPLIPNSALTTHFPPPRSLGILLLLTLSPRKPITLQTKYQ